MSNETKIIPEVGMGATIGYGSDRYPYTIHKISPDGKKIWASEDKHHVVPKEGGYAYGSDIPYTYSNNNQNDESQWSLFTLRKNGRYIQKESSRNSGSYLTIGFRRYYQDPSF